MDQKRVKLLTEVKFYDLHAEFWTPYTSSKHSEAGLLQSGNTWAVELQTLEYTEVGADLVHTTMCVCVCFFSSSLMFSCTPTPLQWDFARKTVSADLLLTLTIICKWIYLHIFTHESQKTFKFRKYICSFIRNSSQREQKSQTVPPCFTKEMKDNKKTFVECK